VLHPDQGSQAFDREPALASNKIIERAYGWLWLAGRTKWFSQKQFCRVRDFSIDKNS